MTWNCSVSRVADGLRRKELSTTLRDAISLTATATGKETEGLTSPAGRMDAATAITTKDGIDISYKGRGQKSAQPIAFHRGWPLRSDSRENQTLFFGGAS
ncbi:hypothetical protein [Bradyrhizobium iriomotense]|uniref:Uncharacterized protein n=1 Tax=Bradyrhizobium iriomotense TaxID=441950 RepID=A0ABQ6APB1_9BRAD|nr:hypothetical protein GCM10007857_08120 [Bradyrhizobium iriomotense]